jgi:DNA-directed RNA polymerase subunit RPC12/RpoP
MKNNKVELSNRNAAFVELKEFCHFSMGERKGKGDFLEVTEWSNGEGYDIHISDVNGKNKFEITNGQMEALFKCVKSIDETLGKEFYESSDKSISVHRQETIGEEGSTTTSTNSGLVSLDEHNSIAWSSQVNMYSNEPKPNGIACTKCGNELMDSNPMMTLTSHPAQKNVHCPKCGYTGYRIA